VLDVDGVSEVSWSVLLRFDNVYCKEKAMVYRINSRIPYLSSGEMGLRLESSPYSFGKP
jgi:hypothetical protein